MSTPRLSDASDLLQSALNTLASLPSDTFREGEHSRFLARVAILMIRFGNLKDASTTVGAISMSHYRVCPVRDMAILLAQQGDSIGAREAVNLLTDVALSHSVSILMRIATIERQRGETEKGMETLSTAHGIALGETNLLVRLMLLTAVGREYWLSGAISAAQEAFAIVEQNLPQIPEQQPGSDIALDAQGGLHAWLALNYAQIGDFEAAHQQIEQIEMEATRTQARFGIFQAYLNADDIENALTAALTIDNISERAKMVQAIARHLGASGQEAAMKKQFHLARRIIQQIPSYYQRGCSLIQLIQNQVTCRDRDGAELSLRRASRLRGKHVPELLAEARCSFAFSDSTSAFSVIKETIGSIDDNFTACLILSHIALWRGNVGDREGAVLLLDYLELLDDKEKHQMFSDTIATTRARFGDFEGAERVLKNGRGARCGFSCRILHETILAERIRHRDIAGLQKEMEEASHPVSKIEYQIALAYALAGEQFPDERGWGGYGQPSFLPGVMNWLVRIYGLITEV